MVLSKDGNPEYVLDLEAAQDGCVSWQGITGLTPGLLECRWWAIIFTSNRERAASDLLCSVE